MDVVVGFFGVVDVDVNVVVCVFEIFCDCFGDLGKVVGFVVCVLVVGWWVFGCGCVLLGV